MRRRRCPAATSSADQRRLEELRLLQALSSFASLGHRAVPSHMLAERLERCPRLVAELTRSLELQGLVRSDGAVSLDLASWSAVGVRGISGLFARHVRAAPSPPPDSCSLAVFGHGPPVLSRPAQDRFFLPGRGLVPAPLEEAASSLDAVDPKLPASQNLWRLRSVWGGNFSATLALLYGGGVEGQTYMDLVNEGWCFLLAYSDEARHAARSGADLVCVSAPRAGWQYDRRGYELVALSGRKAFLAGGSVWTDGQRRHCALPGAAARGVFVLDVGPLWQP